MLTRILHLRRDERGLAFIYVSLGFMAFFAATTLAIDVGMFMTARSQAQNAADAGAHAGAVALAFNSYTDRAASGPAVQSAVTAALSNQVIGANVSVAPADVTFPLDPSGQADRVRVNVFRTSDRGNPVPTLIGTLFGVSTVNVNATATAEAAPANAETCVMPFTIPDKWQENSDPPFTPNTSRFEMFDKKGKPIAHPDVYIAPGHEGATGYSPETDRGLLLVLKNNNEDKAAPSFYNPWDIPGSTGGDDYRDNIANCNTHIVKIGDPMIPENGNMVGPTSQGVEDLVAKDPSAYWDAGCNCVKGSAFGISPRVAIVPLYNPYIYETGKQTGKNLDLQVANYLGFFIVGMQGNEVVGRITPVGGLISGDAGPAPGAFPRAIRIVQ